MWGVSSLLFVQGLGKTITALALVLKTKGAQPQPPSGATVTASPAGSFYTLPADAAAEQKVPVGAKPRLRRNSSAAATSLVEPPEPEPLRLHRNSSAAAELAAPPEPELSLLRRNSMAAAGLEASTSGPGRERPPGSAAASVSGSGTPVHPTLQLSRNQSGIAGPPAMGIWGMNSAASTGAETPRSMCGQGAACSGACTASLLRSGSGASTSTTCLNDSPRRRGPLQQHSPSYACKSGRTRCGGDAAVSLTADAAAWRPTKRLKVEGSPAGIGSAAAGQPCFTYQYRHSGEGTPPDCDSASATWIQCDLCDKWRQLPSDFSVDVGEEEPWHCAMHPDPRYNKCSAPAEEVAGSRLRFQKVPGYVSKEGGQQGQDANQKYLQGIVQRHLKTEDHKHVLNWLSKLTVEEHEEGFKASLCP